MTAPHRAPLTNLRPTDEQAARSQDDSHRKIRDLQARKLRHPVRVFFDSGAAEVERTIFDAFEDVRIVSAHWEQSADLAASGSDFWTLLLRERTTGGETRTIGRVSTASEGFTAFKRRAFEPLLSPIVKRGGRVTFEISETGTATAYGPGSVVLLLEEVPR